MSVITSMPALRTLQQVELFHDANSADCYYKSGRETKRKKPQHSRQEGSFMRKIDDRLLHVECVSAPHENVFGQIVNFSLDINSSKQCAHDTASGFIRRCN